MTTKPIRTIAAAAAVLAAGLVLAACESDNASGPSKAEVKDAISANAGGSATTTTATTPATTTTQATTTTTTQATTTTTAPPAADGKAIFTANCAACHTLAAAGASGQVGPNLDEAKPSKALALNRVTNGQGGMPSFKGQLSPAEITAVATYVADNAGK